MSTHYGPDLAARGRALREALDLGGERFTARVAAGARRDLSRVERRLALGVDWTVVALVGGTGSGKSSLFNAISRLHFARVGVRRPTTSLTAACVWGGEAGELLEFLEVAPNQRIRRESILDDGAEDGLGGLVLLDVPDHDSVDLDNARIVDKLLPLVDLLVWVVDPQKYADNALHERYLQEMAERDGSMLVLVNQIDTVPDSGRGQILGDVRRLLDADGLPGVPVLATSAATGEGIGEVRGKLSEVVAGASMAARVAELEIADVARRLAADLEGLGLAQALGGPDRASAVYRLARASGVEAVESALRESVSPRRHPVIVRPGAPELAAAVGVRDDVVASAGQGLPSLWARDLDRAVGSGEKLRAAVAAELDKVEVPPLGRGGLWRWVAALAVLVATAAAVLGLLDLGTGESFLGPAPGLVAAFGAVVAVTAVMAERARRIRAAARRADEFGEAARAAVWSAVQDVLHDPVSKVVGEHLATRARIARARSTSPADPADGAPAARASYKAAAAGRASASAALAAAAAAAWDSATGEPADQGEESVLPSRAG